MGPVGMLCVQRTLIYGRKVGMLTGYGATLSDLTYALLTLVGVGAFIDVVQEYSNPLQIAGSLFIMGFAIYMLRSSHRLPAPKARFPKHRHRVSGEQIGSKKNENIEKKEYREHENAIKPTESAQKSNKQFFISAFLLTFSNILIVLLYIGLFAQFSFVQQGATFGTLLIGLLGIGIGALSWWYTITHIIVKVSEWFNFRSLKWINRSLGIILMLFGIIAFVSAILETWQTVSIAF